VIGWSSVAWLEGNSPCKFTVCLHIKLGRSSLNTETTLGQSLLPSTETSLGKTYKVVCFLGVYEVLWGWNNWQCELSTVGWAKRTFLSNGSLLPFCLRQSPYPDFFILEIHDDLTLVTQRHLLAWEKKWLGTLWLISTLNSSSSVFNIYTLCIAMDWRNSYYGMRHKFVK
jgi:hypothetical protein